MKQLLTIVLMLMFVCAMLAGCASPEPADPADPAANEQQEAAVAEPIVWIMVDAYETATSHYQQRHEMLAAINERTNGMLEIRHYTASEMSVTNADMLSVVSDNSVQMSASSFSYTEGECYYPCIADWPMLCPTNAETDIVIETLRPWIDEVLSEKNIEMMEWWSTLGLSFFGVGDAPQTINDFSGKKIRLFSAPLSDLMLKYGAVPVTMSLGETIPAMQRNVVDGALTGCVTAYDSAWYDVIDWAYILHISGSANGIFVNQEALAALPEDIQQIVREEVKKYHDRNYEYNETETLKCIEAFEEMGIEVVYSTEEEIAEITERSRDIWYEQAESYGPDCVEALEAALKSVGK